jgi:ubiquinol-cytochrome c reductase iron-sulfur subunit
MNCRVLFLTDQARQLYGKVTIMANGPTQKTTAGEMIMDSIRPESEIRPDRRQFLIAAAGVLGAGAVGLFADVLIDNMNPGKAVEALGAPIDVDVSRMEPGQLLLVEWKKKPVWILKREDWMLKTLSEPSLLRRLKDPHSKQNQQPAQAYVNGNYRALRPDMFVAVALCTHMQCIPDYRPAPHTVTPWWPGGFHCACHGSMYDFSARVLEGSPAPLNIPIPPYYWKTATVVTIGEVNKSGTDKNWTPDIW